jgi:hypothetical protein
MGILDDAIREHLELKRKHGAEEEEVTRQETEALGPARRDVAVQAEPAAEPPVAEAAQAAPEPDPTHGDPHPHADTQVHPDPGGPPHEIADPRVHPDPDAPPPPAPLVPPPEPVFHEDDPSAPPPPVPGFAPQDQGEADDTAPFEPADYPESALPSDRRATTALPSISEDDEPGEGDVLEETPEFLQETPEHDRLWFEQKPPRDFDFDD